MEKKDRREELTITHKAEKRILHTLFFLFGFGIMAWVPRFPEVKDNLKLSNGAFGWLLTTGSIGAFCGLLVVGHIVHKVGVLKVSVVSAILLYGSFAAVVHIKSPVYFAICNVIIAFAITAMHVALNTQGFHVQERSGEIVVTSSAGYWSTGALVTAGVSGLMVGKVGLALHIDIVSIATLVVTLYLLLKLRPVLVKANTHPETDYRVRDIFTSFHVDWPVSLGMASCIYMEFAVGDWATIFTKERLGIDSGLSAAPYIVFTIFIIVGRLQVHKILHLRSIAQISKVSTVSAGIIFALCISVATHLPPESKWVAFTLFIIGFSVAGLGSSILGPSYSSAANRRSPHPSSVVVGQFGVMNNVLTTALKWVVAGVIAATGSIALAFMIPALLMVISAYFTHVLDESKPSQTK
jgi:predicted MFS family arabinose efflux permease